MRLSKLNRSQRLLMTLVNNKQCSQLKVCLQTHLHLNHQLQRNLPQQLVCLPIIVHRNSYHSSVLRTLITLMKLRSLGKLPKGFYLAQTQLIRLRIRRLMISLHSFLVILRLKHLCLEDQHQVCSVKVQLPHLKLRSLDNLTHHRYLGHQGVFLVQHLQQRHCLANQQAPQHYLVCHKTINQVFLINPHCSASKSLRKTMKMMMARLKHKTKHQFTQKVATIKLCLSKAFRLKNLHTRKCLM